MPPFHLTGFPRRSRVLLVMLIFFCVLLFLPKPGIYVGRTLLFFLFSPDIAGPYGHKGSNLDVLKYIDPLIGTTNGGWFSRLWTVAILAWMRY